MCVCVNTPITTVPAGAVCGELGQRTPGGGVVTHVYVSLGELPAVLVAASLLLDLVLLPALGRCCLVLHAEPRLNVTYTLSWC